MKYSLSEHEKLIIFIPTSAVFIQTITLRTHQMRFRSQFTAGEKHRSKAMLQQLSTLQIGQRLTEKPRAWGILCKKQLAVEQFELQERGCAETQMLK